MRAPKGLCWLLVRKVATWEHFQTLGLFGVQASVRLGKASVPQNQGPVTDLRQGAIMRGNND